MSKLKQKITSFIDAKYAEGIRLLDIQKEKELSMVDFVADFIESLNLSESEVMIKLQNTFSGNKQDTSIRQDNQNKQRSSTLDEVIGFINSKSDYEEITAPMVYDYLVSVSSEYKTRKPLHVKSQISGIFKKLVKRGLIEFVRKGTTTQDPHIYRKLHNNSGLFDKQD